MMSPTLTPHPPWSCSIQPHVLSPRMRLIQATQQQGNTIARFTTIIHRKGKLGIRRLMGKSYVVYIDCTLCHLLNSHLHKLCKIHTCTQIPTRSHRTNTHSWGRLCLKPILKNTVTNWRGEGWASSRAAMAQTLNYELVNDFPSFHKGPSMVYYGRPIQQMCLFKRNFSN